VPRESDLIHQLWTAPGPAYVERESPILEQARSRAVHLHGRVRLVECFQKTGNCPWRSRTHTASSPCPPDGNRRPPRDRPLTFDREQGATYRRVRQADPAHKGAGVTVKHPSAILAGALVSAAWLVSAAAAQPACVGANAALPAGANTTDHSAPFYIDTTGLDFRTAPPTRDPASTGYPRATELPDGTLPPAGAEGNFIIGPTHRPAAETVAQASIPHGTIHTFTITSGDSVIYNPGVIRDDPPNCPNGSVRAAQTAPGDPSNLILTTSHPGSWTRTVDVFVPAAYVRGAEAPFIVFGDGGANGSYPGRDLFAVLDNLIQQRRVPPMIAIGIGSGGQDSSGSERGREYDTVSGAYAEWVEREVLPRVEQQSGAKLTKNPDGRATMGISSSGAAAFTMAWFHPELYRRVLAYSPTFVNQQWPHAS
jgi:hypothetical protein